MRTSLLLVFLFLTINLRGRVSSVSLDDNGDGVNEYNSFFDYDVHGSVKSLLQEDKALDSVIANGVKQSLKRIDYDYDLVSGNVKAVHYQSGKTDQFHHRYEYNADNKITNVYTSKDSIIWDQDAKYFYYATGPQSRVELGDNKVQGIDFAYTLAGWAKGINSDALLPNRDMGKDADNNTGNLNKFIARDAFGYSLSYYNGDYQPIGNPLQTDNFLASLTGSSVKTNAPDLYNGNISTMVTTITNPTTNVTMAQAQAYKYDQLNRITQMKAYRDITASTNTWGTGAGYDGSYEEQYTYNANGSILTLKRNGILNTGANPSPLEMDNITNVYETVANGYTRNTNKLRYKQDAVASTKYTDDIDNQSANNYDYDEIGNLKKDDFECIEKIDWTVYGKVKSVKRKASCTTEGTAMPDLEFAYDATGNLIEKIVKPAATLADVSTWIHTYYVHDASGNIMATYEKTGSTFKLAEQELYGSGHLGTAMRDLDLTATTSTSIFTRTLGKKQFFLSDHRGNNNVTVLDRKIPVESTSTPGTIAYFEPKVDRAVDYYPFGREMNGRFFSKDNSEFGYNGKQNIKEWSARLGSVQNYGARIKIGEGFASGDPITKQYPELTPYQYASNTPIQAIDIDGLEAGKPIILGGPALVKGTGDVAKFIIKSALIVFGQFTKLAGDINSSNLQRTPEQKAVYEKSAKDNALQLFTGVMAGYGIGKVIKVASGAFGSAMEGEAFSSAAGNTTKAALAENASMAKSFKGGKFDIVEAAEDVTVYRVSSTGQSGNVGEFFTTIKPKSTAEAEKLLNVGKHGNTATEVTPFTIKKGSQFAIGQVEGGEGTQIFIPKAVQNASGNKLIKAGAAEPLPAH